MLPDPGSGALLLDHAPEVAVAADGADFETVAFDSTTGTMRLRLLIPDARCAECVMPRATLESIAATRLARHGVHTVVIDDPREVVD